MSKWSLLKSALVSKDRDHRSSQSIHRFTGFKLCDQHKVLWPGFNLYFNNAELSSLDNLISVCCEFLNEVDTSECILHADVSDGLHKDIITKLDSSLVFRLQSRQNTTTIGYITHKSFRSSLPQCEYWRYEVSLPQESSSTSKVLTLHTREKARAGGVNVQALLSNKLHGVDNTGNICVWPAESLLLHTLLNSEKYLALVRGARVLELGGGMTALAGLGLATAGVAAHVVVTDGHPDCVRNQKVCIRMTAQMTQCDDTSSKRPTNISSHLLHWSLNINAVDVSAILGTTAINTNNAIDGTASGDHTELKLFDVVIASDCLFFRDFHEDLIGTLRQVLRPGGVGIFLQPARDGTMQRFIDHCKRSCLFSAELQPEYNPQVAILRNEYLAKQEELGYSEDVHYPQMLLIRALY